MNPATTYRVVGVRSDGSVRLLCGQIVCREMAERVALAVSYESPFASIAVQDELEPLDGQAQEDELVLLAQTQIQDESDSACYNVVVVNDDDSREVLAENLTHRTAMSVQSTIGGTISRSARIVLEMAEN